MKRRVKSQPETLKATVWGIKVPMAFTDSLQHHVEAFWPIEEELRPERAIMDDILLVSRSALVQRAIERNVIWGNSKENDMMMDLQDNPALVFDVEYSVIKDPNCESYEDDLIAHIVSFKARPKGRELNA